MSKRKQIIYGFIITIMIFLIANIAGAKIHLNGAFLPNLFMNYTTMLLLSIVVIALMNKNSNFRISIPKLGKTFKPFFVGVIITVVVNILMTIVVKLVGGEMMSHPLSSKMNVLQLFLFVFILASVAEEILFRGFLQNSLNSLSKNGITIFKCKFSLPVVISAIAFGLAHLVLISSGVNPLFLVRIVLFTTILGIAAGYYQEKYNNTSYAILVHMGGNLPAILGALMMNIQ